MSWVSWQRGNHFESVAFIRFEKFYLIFMSGCFKSFDVSHDFSKAAALLRNHVVWVTLTIYQNMHDSVNDEEQLLRVFRSI